MRMAGRRHGYKPVVVRDLVVDGVNVVRVAEADLLVELGVSRVELDVSPSSSS
jgi:hypothetical protein